jgi:NAD+ synthase
MSDERKARELLSLDPERTVERMSETIRELVFKRMKRKGAVVGLSGGIDSSVVGALCARALGAERVVGLFMPEADSSDESLNLGRALTERLGIQAVIENITPILDAAGCYTRRDAAIRKVVPQYGSGWKSKIVLPNVLDNEGYKLFSVVVQSPSGEQIKARLTADAYQGVLAATNFKQRVRAMMEYYHADLRQYAVAGTPNRLEYDQGFFVKIGDGAADFKPIAHLYKTQVYDLAEFLGVPKEIRMRPPTTDTYSLAQSQEEFYFSLPYQQMDVCLYGKNHGIPASETARMLGLTEVQVERVYRDIEAKRAATRYLHLPPLLVEKVEEIG